MKKRLIIVLVSLVILGEAAAFSQDTNSIEILRITYPVKNDLLKMYSDRFEQKAVQRLELIKFGDPLEPDPRRINSIGQGISLDSLGDTSRQWAEELPLRYVLENGCQNMFNVLGDHVGKALGSFTRVFVGNTINGVDEQDIDPTALTFQPSEHRWWKKMREDGYFSYGIRPQSSPYAFLGTHVSIHNHELVLINFRYYWRKFESSRVKLLLTFPLGNKWELDSGLVYSPDKESRRSRTELVSVLRFERHISENSTLFFGTQLGKDQSILAGLIYKFK